MKVIILAAGQNIRSETNPQGIPIVPSPPFTSEIEELLLISPELRRDTVSFKINIDLQKLPNRDPLDVALELVLASATIQKSQQQFDKTPKFLPGDERLNRLYDLRNTAIFVERGAYSRAELARTLIYARAIGINNPIGPRATRHTVEFIKSGLDENSAS